METKLGNIENKYLIKSFDKMIGKVFKILHLKEENCITLDKYVDSICRKFIGASNLYFDEEILMIIYVLKGMDLNNHNSIRSDVFEIIKILESLKEKM